MRSRVAGLARLAAARKRVIASLAAVAALAGLLGAQSVGATTTPTSGPLTAALAKRLSPSVEAAVLNAMMPPAVVGVVIAAMVLLPEGLAALRAAHADRIQTSLNLALGSALASIGLTIPTVATVFILLGRPLILGLDSKEMVLLFLTMIVASLTLGMGRTTILQGVVHLMILAAYLFLTIVP
jgi:Ca2+:H+ antiporter